MARKRPENYKDVARERIIYLMEQFTEDQPGRQQAFADMVGVSKNSMSQYINGSNAPGSVAASKIAKRCNVDPLWVMGMDVPMRPSVDDRIAGNPILRIYEHLSPLNKQKAETYLNILLTLQQQEDEISDAKWVKDVPVDTSVRHVRVSDGKWVIPADASVRHVRFNIGNDEDSELTHKQNSI